MESSYRPRNQLGRRSIIARIAALLALIASILALYLVYTNFIDNEDSSGDKTKTEQAQGKDKKPEAETYTVVAGDTLSAIAQKTKVPESRLERLNPELDSESLNAGQVLKLR